LDRGELADPGREGRIAKDSYSRHVRRKLFKQFKPYSGIAPTTVELGKEALPTLSR
jgi:hypothetical protein